MGGGVDAHATSMSMPVKAAAARSCELQSAFDGAFISVLYLDDGGHRRCRPSIRSKSMCCRRAYVGAPTYITRCAVVMPESERLSGIGSARVIRANARPAKRGVVLQSMRSPVINTMTVAGCSREPPQTAVTRGPEEQAVVHAVPRRINAVHLAAPG